MSQKKSESVRYKTNLTSDRIRHSTPHEFVDRPAVLTLRLVCLRAVSMNLLS